MAVMQGAVSITGSEPGLDRALMLPTCNVTVSIANIKQRDANSPVKL